ncbi:MAG TPA: hypothetical protein VFW16_11480 [Streptosporangiaceae bacterium]|nr:hypothetical protein [Streptosporangiaceae bacterium]
MTVSWQTVRTPSTAPAEAGLASGPDNTDERVRDGPEPDPGDADIVTPLPHVFTDGDARRAALRELVLRALI